MARDRYDDEDDREDDRPRGRSRDDDYDDDSADRPRSRGQSGNLSGMDGFLNSTGTAIVLALFSFCCCPIAGIVLGGIGLATCKNPDSKRNAMIVLVAGGIGAITGIILQFTGALGNFQQNLK